MAETTTPTPWAVICPEHGRVFLTRLQYDRQMNRPNQTWTCPRCGDFARWDDATYERYLDERAR